MMRRPEPSGPPGAINDVLAVRPEGGECVVVQPRSDGVIAGAIGVEDGNLRTAIRRVDGLLVADFEVEEGTEESHANHNLFAIGGPGRSQNQILLLEDRTSRLAFIDDREGS